MPKSLEIGMLFIEASEEGIQLFELNSIPRDEEKFIIDNGSPVELFIVDGDDVIVEPHEIGWIDEGGDNLYPISLEEINYILNECDGWLELEIIEDFFDEDEQIVPNFVDEKVIIRIRTEE
ncbi:MAG: hypothetical protein ACK5XN_18655 [Bacteroidota bacterium]